MNRKISLIALSIILLFSNCEKNKPEPAPAPSTELYKSSSKGCSTCLHEYVDSYIVAYFNSLSTSTVGYSNEADLGMILTAHLAATVEIQNYCCITSSAPEIEVNLSNIVFQLQYDPTITQQERDNWVGIINYLDLVSPIASPGRIVIQPCI